jgi:hypothetical protein
MNNDETLYLAPGMTKIEYAREAWLYYSKELLKPAQYLSVQFPWLYRITAETDCVFLETSNRSNR